MACLLRLKETRLSSPSSAITCECEHEGHLGFVGDRSYGRPHSNLFTNACLDHIEMLSCRCQQEAEKAFLPRLAVGHALPRGWVLYLVPTNALAHQIRRDLYSALAPFGDVNVSAFVGGPEYTALSEEELELERPFVTVMTPEKCALALRLYPSTFKRCALCVFDECHLLNDPNRGALADILLAQLFHAAPSMRLLLIPENSSEGMTKGAKPG